MEWSRSVKESVGTAQGRNSPPRKGGILHGEVRTPDLEYQRLLAPPKVTCIRQIMLSMALAITLPKDWLYEQMGF
ncbi:hypothetical protein DSO57_1022602 [Entomophthora muscae]|uniref:Uncharacterized protein n=1 Tax=Entomophthora muscae TaxID=34485 RepID=A0ACC2UP12_9FUNG|nr:hypothetical protein DSO57_1022602 [Entomophthora muscae]